jgi:hypothetical protein
MRSGWVIGFAWSGVVVGCAGDARPACADVVKPGRIEVDRSSGTPVFSWSTGAVLEELSVTCEVPDGDDPGRDPELEDTWWVGCSGWHAHPRGEPTGTACITSPLVYGEDPDGAQTEDPDYYTPARPLEPGARCELTLEQRCASPDALHDVLHWTRSFVAP